MKEAEESLQTAHESHRELLKMDASGEVTQVSILLCHAQDHLMGSALALDLIREMIVFISKVGKSKEESYGTKSIIDLRRWDVYRNSDA
ncbi:MAG: PTS lactose/cellobiose transporter subunit IIA [Waltera sp.]